MSGRLLERGALRYTPAGIPVVEFTLGHDSHQCEAGRMRKVDLEIPCVAMAEWAQLLSGGPSPSGQADAAALRVEGFLAARSLKRRTPVLHVTHIEFVEGA